MAMPPGCCAANKGGRSEAARGPQALRRRVRECPANGLWKERQHRSGTRFPAAPRDLGVTPAGPGHSGRSAGGGAEPPELAACGSSRPLLACNRSSGRGLFPRRPFEA
ncbi:unnamed protein product [Coccothraustes coccothraustes]